MGWMAIAAALLQLFGPLIVDVIEDCTKERLDDAAKELEEEGKTPESFATEGEAAQALIMRAHDRLPKVRVFRRRAFLRMHDAAVEDGKVRTRPLTAAELEEGRDLVGGVRNE